VLSASVPLWMNTAEKTSVGGRPLVLENGPDVMHSSDEDSAVEEHGEALTGMYTEGLKAPVLLSRFEVDRQRAMHNYAVTVGYGKWINSDAMSSDMPSSNTSQTSLWFSRLDTPAQSTGGSSCLGTPVNSDNEDQEEMTEEQKRCLRRAKRRSGPAQPPRSSTPVSGIVESVPQKVQPPRPATPVAPSSVSVPPDPPSPKKGKAKVATRPIAKGATRPEDQEHPMTIRMRSTYGASHRS
jgi:hypothetical protein